VLIKVLFAIMVLSLATLIGVSVAVFIRVRRHWKQRREHSEAIVEPPAGSNPEHP
jgi:hypothetical protein